MDASDLQQSLFKEVKQRMPAHLSLADEVATLLGVSADSAYRRIRGEKLMDINELSTISRQFRISLDALMGQQPGGYLFSGRFINENGFTFETWLASLGEQLASVLQGTDPVFIYQSKDLPLFHHFQFPELTRFKFFFWRKTILQMNGPGLEKVRLDVGDESLIAAARKVHLTYERLPSTEIWNVENFNSTLHQINFYRETGLFARDGDAQLLFDQVLLLIERLERQAEAGRKFAADAGPEQGTATFKLYLNEVLLGDNAIYADNGRQRVVFLNHSGINYIGTADVQFCDHTRKALENIMHRSTLISGTGEKERKRLFRLLREEVERKRK